MRDFLFYLTLSGFVLGILLSSFIPVNPFVSLFLLLVSGAVFLYWLFLKRHRIPVGNFFLVFSIVLCSFAGGALRFYLSDVGAGDAILDRYAGDEVLLEGVIVDEPDLRESNVRYTVRFDALLQNEESVPVLSKGIITADFYPRFQYGDRIYMRGRLEKPENFESELGREFNYTGFLAKDGIYYQIFRPEIQFLESGKGNVAKEKIFAFKHAFLGHMGKTISEPESSLMGGLLLGTKQSLGRDSLDDFRKTGLIHIVVLSGYNITIVAESIIAFFSLALSGILAGILGVVSISLFAVMTGAGATVVRASIMAVLVIIARLTRRTYRMDRALFLAGVFMLLHNPKILVFDPSFQLSFLATVSLIYIAPVVEKYFLWVPVKWKLRETVTSTISTQMFVFPAILYMMGELSIVALPVNLLVLLIIPMTMLFGFLAGLFGFVWSVLAWPFGLVAHTLLSYIFIVVELFAALPFASIRVSWFPLWLAIAVYTAYVFIMFKIQHTQNARRRLAVEHFVIRNP